jgi:hypothetical protein
VIIPPGAPIRTQTPSISESCRGPPLTRHLYCTTGQSSGMPSREDFHRWSHHRALSQPTISLALTALSLLLLVLVLLSVPGPIKGLFWFSVDGAGGVDNQPGQGLSAGVLGWCSESFCVLRIPAFPCIVVVLVISCTTDYRLVLSSDSMRDLSDGSDWNE